MFDAQAVAKRWRFGRTNLCGYVVAAAKRYAIRILTLAVPSGANMPKNALVRNNFFVGAKFSFPSIIALKCQPSSCDILRINTPS
jgi:hypothetical protein